MKPVYRLVCIFLLASGLPVQAGQFSASAPSEKEGAGVSRRQLENRISAELQKQTTPSNFEQAQRQLALLLQNAPAETISWEEYQALNKSAAERTEVAYHLDLETLKQSTQREDQPLVITMHNSFPNYKELLKGFRYIYVGEEHYTKTLPAEMIRIMQAVRQLYPDKRILLASEFVKRLREEDSPLIKLPHSEFFISIYPQVNQEAKRLNMDVLALDDFQLSFRQEDNDVFLTAKCGRYWVSQQHKIPESEMKNEFFSPSFLNDWEDFSFLVSISPFGVLERNRQWARYINAVKPFYDIIILYAGYGHIDDTKMNDIQHFVGPHDFVSITLLPTEEGEIPLSPEERSAMFSQAEKEGILYSQLGQDVDQKKKELFMPRLQIKGSWDNPNKPFWGYETVEEAPLTDAEKKTLFSHRNILIALPPTMPLPEDLPLTPPFLKLPVPHLKPPVPSLKK